ncbi:MAG TPA: hypothetical protein VD994_02765 [Prosthecobacter sp.]|nr:hypothetical protein [Prosthecobacter sp.]
MSREDWVALYKYLGLSSPGGGLEGALLAEEPSAEEFGELVGLPCVELLHRASQIIGTKFDRETRHLKLDQLHRKIADLVVDAIYFKDSSLFDQLARLIEIDSRGRQDAQLQIDNGKELDPDYWVPPLALVKRSQIAPDRAAGRKKKPYDIARAGERAVMNCLIRRVMGIDGSPVVTYKVSRAELRDEIRKIQRGYGMNPPSKVSDSQLSEVIRAAKVQRFMGRH